MESPRHALPAGVVWLSRSRMRDSNTSSLPLEHRALRPPSTPPAPGARLHFTRHRLLQGPVTSSGVAVARAGVTAVRSRRCCPSARWCNSTSGGPRTTASTRVLDIGPEVQGREVDLYMWSCNEALRVRPEAGAHDRATARVESRRDDARPLRSRFDEPNTSRPAVTAAAGSAGRGTLTTSGFRRKGNRSGAWRLQFEAIFNTWA